MEEETRFGAALRAIRQRTGESQAKVARRAKMDQASLCRVELGNYAPPRVLMVPLLARAYLATDEETDRLCVLAAQERAEVDLHHLISRPEAVGIVVDLARYGRHLSNGRAEALRATVRSALAEAAQ